MFQQQIEVLNMYHSFVNALQHYWCITWSFRVFFRPDEPSYIQH